MKPILSISEAEVSQALSVRKSILLARQAYVKRAMERILEPPRTWFTIPGGASFYFMPAHVLGLRTVTVKVVSVKRGNGNRSLSSTSATIYVFADILALKEVDTLGIIGTGKQAQAHVPGILEVRKVSQVLVYSRSNAHRAAFVRRVSKNTSVPVIAATSAEEAARNSDILVLATSSPVPLFRGGSVSRGTHVNAIGAALPNSREMDTALVKRSVLIVDSFEQAVASYGDIMIPLKERAITKAHIRAELGELVLDPSIIRRGKNDITIFKGGGLAVLDAIFADYLVSRL